MEKHKWQNKSKKTQVTLTTYYSVYHAGYVRKISPVY